MSVSLEFDRPALLICRLFVQNKNEIIISAVPSYYCLMRHVAMVRLQRVLCTNLTPPCLEIVFIYLVGHLLQFQFFLALLSILLCVAISYALCH